LSAISKHLDSVVIATANPKLWQDQLSSISSQVIVLLIGNETYKPDIYKSLNDLDNLKYALVYNPPITPRVHTSYLTLLGYLLDGGLGKHNLPGSVWRDFIISISRKRIAKESFISKPYSVLSQGYSNNFAFNFSHMFNKLPGDSLFNLKESEAFFKRNRLRDLQFVGQSTNRRRENFLKKAKLFGAEIRMTTSFGGTKTSLDTSYVESLLESVFTLVPPGHFNNYNHRYAESLICGSIPCVLSNNSLDPTPNINWTNSLRFPTNVSSKYQIKYLLETSPEDRYLIWSKAIKECQNSIKASKKLLNSMLAG